VQDRHRCRCRDNNFPGIPAFTFDLQHQIASIKQTTTGCILSFHHQQCGLAVCFLFHHQQNRQWTNGHAGCVPCHHQQYERAELSLMLVALTCRYSPFIVSSVDVQVYLSPLLSTVSSVCTFLYCRRTGVYPLPHSYNFDCRNVPDSTLSLNR